MVKRVSNKPRLHRARRAISPSQAESVSPEIAETFPELLEPDRAAKRAAFLIVIVLIIVVGLAGAAIEVFLKPLLTGEVSAPPQPIREVHMRVDGSGYTPSVLTVRAHEPILWIIDAENATGCGQVLIVPDYNITQSLAGVVEIRVTPAAPGRIPFSCPTAEIQGHFIVE